MYFHSTLTDISHLSIIFIVWNLAAQKIRKKIEVARPNNDELFKYKDHQNEIVNYAPEHVLNTPGAK